MRSSEIVVVLIRSRSPGESQQDDDREEEGRCSTWCRLAGPAPSRRHPAAGSRPRTLQSPAGCVGNLDIKIIKMNGKLTSKGRERKRPSARRGESTPVACASLSSRHCESQLGHTRLNTQTISNSYSPLINLMNFHCTYYSQ